MDLKGAGEWGTIQSEENLFEDKSKTNHLVFTGESVLWMLSLNSYLGLHVPEGSSKAVLDLEVEVIPGHIGRPELQLDLSKDWEEHCDVNKWSTGQAAKFDLSNSVVRASSAQWGWLQLIQCGRTLPGISS